MADQNLIRYIRENLAAGFVKDKIQEALLAAGWQPAQIKEAFDEIAPPKPLDVQTAMQKISTESKNQNISLGDDSQIKKSGLAAILKSKYVWIAAVVIIGLAGLGVGAYSYFFPSPEKVVNSAIEKMSESVTSYKYKFSLDVGSKKIASVFKNNFFGTALLGVLQETAPLQIPDYSSDYKATVMSAGSMDFADINNPKTEANLEISVPEITEIFSIFGEIKLINDEFYLRLKDIPTKIGMPELENQWMRFSKKEAEDLANEPNSEFGEIYQEYKKELETQTGKKSVDKAQEEQIRTLVQQTKFFSIKERLKDEVLNQDDEKTKTYHYSIKFNEQEIKKFTEEISKISGIEKEYNTSQKEINGAIDELIKINGELWIGKNDRLIHKILFNGENLGEGSQMGGFFSASLSLFNFNKSAGITKPDNFKTLKEVFQIITDKLEDARDKARDARRQSDIQQISLAMEMYYDSHKASYPDLPNAPTPVPPASKTLDPYMPAVPIDPANSGDYIYYWTDSGKPKKGYCVWARLETQTVPTFVVANQLGVTKTTTIPTKDNCYLIEHEGSG